MAFPTTSLVNNQVHKEGNRAWVYDAPAGVWDQVTEVDTPPNHLHAGVTFPAGHVLQVKSTTLRNVFSVAGEAFVSIGGLTAAIIPTSTSSKVLIMITIGRASANPARGSTVAFRIERLAGSSMQDIGVGKQTAGSQLEASFVIKCDSNTNYSPGGFSTSFLDSPATNQLRTYGLAMVAEGATNASIAVINRSYLGSTGADIYNAISQSTITVMEIAG